MDERFFQSPQPIELDAHTPLIFLEGPVQGTPNWQTPFAHRLPDRFPNIAVASRVYAKTTSKEEAELWGVLFTNPTYPFIVGYDPTVERLILPRIFSKFLL